MVEPLSRGQKAFNQRLMAEHCLSDEKCREIWENLAQTSDMGASSFEKSIARSNAQLRYCGLEIVAVSIRDDNNEPTRHYAMINKHNDDIAKKCFQITFTPKQHAFVRCVFEKLVDGPTSRSSLINSKNELEDGHKFPISEAETALCKLVEEKWIQEVKGSARRGSMQANLELAPRTYLELSYLLVDEFGMDKGDLPQQIFHS